MPAADGTYIKATPGEIAAASDTISQASSYLRSQLDQINTDYKALIQVWGGEAAAAFDGQAAKWNTAGDDIQTLLVSIGNATQSAAVVLSAAESANQQRFA